MADVLRASWNKRRRLFSPKLPTVYHAGSGVQRNAIARYRSTKSLRKKVIKSIVRSGELFFID
jgi:hypothetical protein